MESVAGGAPPRLSSTDRSFEVTDQLRGLGAMGYTDVIVRHLADEQADVLASFARLAGVRAAILGT